MKQRNKYIKVTLIIFSCLVFLVSGFSLWARNKGEETPLFSILNYIDTAVKIQSKKAFACGKYETSDAIYTVKVPKSYVFFPISYVGESNWDPSTWVKKEDPCLYDFRSIHFQFEWPSLKPYGRVPPAKHEKKYNVIGVSVDPINNLNKKSQEDRGSMIKEVIIAWLKIALFPNKSFKERDNINNNAIWNQAEYIKEFDLYKKSVHLIKTMPYGERNTRDKHTKQDVFWKADANNIIHSIIVCKYIGPEVDLIPFSDTWCKYRYFDIKQRSILFEIDFLGQHLAQWKAIETATMKLVDSFTTKAEK